MLAPRCVMGTGCLLRPQSALRRPESRLHRATKPLLRRPATRHTALASGDKEESAVLTEATPTAFRRVKQGEPAQAEGPSTDVSVILDRLKKLALPYWTEGEQAGAARWRLAGVFALTLGTTGVSVLFNFLGRDFFNALSAKDQATFTEMLFKWIGAIVLGIPVYVLRDYYQSRLALEWRQWMTESLTKEYFAGRTFYQVQAGALVDNPDQRIAVDVRNFTDTALSFSIVMLNAAVDLVSFSEILYSIYPPLFAALVLYSVGGTAASVLIGRKLVGLNFAQEAQEANFRYGLVRVRENAESIAFYGGEDNEARLLGRRLASVVANYGKLLLASRNLNFFTSFYRFLIQVLPAAVIAPLYFRGQIEFGVINQSASAFNHILGDVSLVVYQFEAIAGFSAVIDRLGEFREVLNDCREGGVIGPSELTASTDESAEKAAAAAARPAGLEGTVTIVDAPSASPTSLLDLRDLTLCIPTTGAPLVQHLELSVAPGHSLLIMGPSGAGKTSLLRTVAGLWSAGSGSVVRHGRPMGQEEGKGDIFFVPQRPYVLLGTLRDQLLYPTWAHPEAGSEPSDLAGDGRTASSSAGDGSAGAVSSASGAASGGDNGAGAASSSGKGDVSRVASNTSSSSSSGVDVDARPLPSDDDMRAVLRRVQLGPLLDRVGGDLDAVADWASTLSLGEQQRLAFGRVLLARPRLVLMDESTSALDTRNERVMYEQLRAEGITFVSVGHRPTLTRYHERVLLLHGAGGWEVRPAAELSLERLVAFMD